MRGEYKTQGGKLVTVEYDVVDETLQNVQVTGDFFLYPEEAIAHITSALEGLPAGMSRESIIASLNSSLNNDVTLVGFSTEAIAIAV
ncbi:MAG: biotin--protein ligase [Chloroflexota bacterium]